MGWPFDSHQVIGEEIGQATVTDQGSRIIHLHFFPANVSVVFTDPDPSNPACPPLNPDTVQITANNKMLEICWSVNEPREIQWNATS